jgi:hypothetical protein
MPNIWSVGLSPGKEKQCFQGFYKRSDIGQGWSAADLRPLWRWVQSELQRGHRLNKTVFRQKISNIINEAYDPNDCNSMYSSTFYSMMCLMESGDIILARRGEKVYGIGVLNKIRFSQIKDESGYSHRLEKVDWQITKHNSSSLKRQKFSLKRAGGIVMVRNKRDRNYVLHLLNKIG